MNTTTLCQVCHNRTAEYQCGRCGTLVCDRHFKAETGLCLSCAGDTPRDDRSE